MTLLKQNKSASKKVGLPPGTAMYIGPPRTSQVNMTITCYGPDRCEEKQITQVEESYGLSDKDNITWIHVNGLHDAPMIEALGGHYAIDPLILEDILNTSHRPKFEEYDDCLFIVLKAQVQDEKDKTISIEHISIVLKSNMVFSFQEGGHDIFQPVRKRIQKSKSRFRQLGADYLVYALSDILVDHTFMVIETLHERIEEIEEDLIETDPDRAMIETIHSLKSTIIVMGRAISPMRELVGKFARSDSEFINEASLNYRRDLLDHTIQIMESLEACREMVKSLIELYHSSVSNKMNEVMKVLTIIATIFIPLGFVAGIYGTNFKYMPELEWRWGYLLFWCLIAGIGVAMVFFFKHKKWF
jgi:magnesium transporter